MESPRNADADRRTWLMNIALRAHLPTTADEHACSLTGEIDLTVSDFDWMAMLESLPAGAEIVGTGVRKPTFRWLRAEMCVRPPIMYKLTVASVTSSEPHELMDLRRMYASIKTLLII